jgi:signal transduction histidine kinase
MLRLEEKDRGAISQVYDLLERQLRSMTRLVDDILNYSRVAVGKVIVRPERVDLAQLVRTITEDYRPVSNEGGLTLTVETPSTPLWVMADNDQVAQILNNLLDNATKFTHPGGRVTLRLEVGGDRRQALLTICDTGAGIDSKALPRIFDLYAQARRTSERSRGGLGLGLALVKKLVALHGGDVSAASEGPCCGSTFVVRLPLLAMENERGKAADVPVLKVEEPQVEGRRLCLFSWRNQEGRI